MHVIRLTSIVCYEIMAGDNLLATEVCPKGRKHIGGGEAPYMRNTEYIAPTGAAEIMKIIINFFHHFGAKFLSSGKWGCVVLLLRGLHPLLYH